MATVNRVGYLEAAYADEGNVLRIGDGLHDIQVDYDPNTHMLGLIGCCDVTLTQQSVLRDGMPLAYLAMEHEGRIMFSYVAWDHSEASIYGFDPELIGVRQAIRIELYGYSCLSIITLKA